jgi:hypothetical protein
LLLVLLGCGLGGLDESPGSVVALCFCGGLIA